MFMVQITITIIIVYVVTGGYWMNRWQLFIFARHIVDISIIGVALNYLIVQINSNVICLSVIRHAQVAG